MATARTEGLPHGTAWQKWFYLSMPLFVLLPDSQFLSCICGQTTSNFNSDGASTCQTRRQECFPHRLCVTGLLQLAWPIVPVCVVTGAHNEKENKVFAGEKLCSFYAAYKDSVWI